MVSVGNYETVVHGIMRQLCYMSYFMLLLRSKGVRQNYEIQTTSSLTTLPQTTNVKSAKL